MKLRISMREAVFTKDLDGDGKAEVPPEREGETGKPEVDLDSGLDDSNNDGKTDSSREMSSDEVDQLEPTDDFEKEEGDDEIADALSALDEDKGKKMKLVIKEEEVLVPEALSRDSFSPFKPWGKESSSLVYYEPKDKTPPLEGGMVRLRGSYSQQGITSKSFDRNKVTIHVWQPGYKVTDGSLDYVEHAIKVDAKYIEPANDGRFVDVANWVLKRKGITDQYASILDFNGKIIATKSQQKKFSNAGAISWDEE